MSVATVADCYIFTTCCSLFLGEAVSSHLLSRKVKNVNGHVIPSEALLIAVLLIFKILDIFEVLIPEFL